MVKVKVKVKVNAKVKVQVMVKVKVEVQAIAFGQHKRNCESERSGDGSVDDGVATGSSIYTARTEWFCERRPHEFVERTVHGTNERETCALGCGSLSDDYAVGISRHRLQKYWLCFALLLSQRA